MPCHVCRLRAAGKKLRLKDLVAVRWTRVPEGETGLHMDPITKDTFTHAHKLVILAATGCGQCSVRLCVCTATAAAGGTLYTLHGTGSSLARPGLGGNGSAIECTSGQPRWALHICMDDMRLRHVLLRQAKAKARAR